MDWSNERYVRIYTRDTADWLMLSWEARSVFLHLVRKADRAGVIELGKHGLRGVAVLISAPQDVVESAVEELVADGCLEYGDNSLVIPNFIEAQEAKQSDTQRKRESRQRRRDQARVAQSQPVTRGHTVSQPVTPSLAEPNQEDEYMSAGDASADQFDLVPETQGPPEAQPLRGEQSLSAKKRRTLKRWRRDVEPLWELQAELRKRAMPRSRGLNRAAKYFVAIAEALDRGDTPDDCRHVLRVTAAEVASGQQDPHWFNGISNWSEKPFAIRLAKPLPRGPIAWGATKPKRRREPPTT